VQTRTTWRHRKKAAKRQKVLTIGLAVFTFLCGTLAGSWWGDKHSKVNQVTYELERTRFDLAKAQFELEKAVKIADIRTNIEAVLLQILDVYSKYSKRAEAADKNASTNKRDKAKRAREMMWESAFSPLKDQLVQLESMLSALENRGPRDFDLPGMEPFIPHGMRRP
jgi:hypothetical protein